MLLSAILLLCACVCSTSAQSLADYNSFFLPTLFNNLATHYDSNATCTYSECSLDSSAPEVCVECAPNSTDVTALVVQNMKLLGHIAYEIQFYDTLQHFIIRNTPLTGSIPQLPPALVTLVLNNNSLSGLLPSLPDTLETLDLSINPALNGSVYGFGNNLDNLNVAVTSVANVSDLSNTNLFYLNIAMSNVDALPPLPPTLRTLAASHNHRLRALPDTWVPGLTTLLCENCTALKSARLIAQPWPVNLTRVAIASSLESFAWDARDFLHTQPMLARTSLQQVRLLNLSMQGGNEWSNFTRLEELSIQNSKRLIVNATLFADSLKILDLHNTSAFTRFASPLYSNLQNLQHLDLSNTDFAGPMSVFDLYKSKLTYLNLSACNLHGGVEFHDVQPPTLKIFDVSHNNLRWCSDDVHLLSVEYVDFSNNEIQSELISPGLKTSVYLMNNNAFYGSMPSALRYARLIDVRNNRLSGTISHGMFSAIPRDADDNCLLQDNANVNTECFECKLPNLGTRTQEFNCFTCMHTAPPRAECLANGDPCHANYTCTPFNGNSTLQPTAAPTLAPLPSPTLAPTPRVVPDVCERCRAKDYFDAARGSDDWCTCCSRNCHDRLADVCFAQGYCGEYCVDVPFCVTFNSGNGKNGNDNDGGGGFSGGTLAPAAHCILYDASPGGHCLACSRTNVLDNVTSDVQFYVSGSHCDQCPADSWVLFFLAAIVAVVAAPLCVRLAESVVFPYLLHYSRFVQLIVLLLSIRGVQWNRMIRRFYDSTSSFNLHWPGISCVFDNTEPHVAWIVVMLCASFVSLLTACVALLINSERFKASLGARARQRVRRLSRPCARGVLVLAAFLYVPLTTLALRAFPETDAELFGGALADPPRVLVYFAQTPRHTITAMRIVACVVLLTVTVAFPALLAVVFRRHHREHTTVQPYSPLHFVAKRYTSAHFNWECVELLYRAVLCAVIALVRDALAAYLTIAAMVALYEVLYVWKRPLRNSLEYFLVIALNVLIVCVLVCGVAVKESQSSRGDVFNESSTVLNVLVLVCVCVGTLAMLLACAYEITRAARDPNNKLRRATVRDTSTGVGSDQSLFASLLSDAQMQVASAQVDNSGEMCVESEPLEVQWLAPEEAEESSDE